MVDPADLRAFAGRAWGEIAAEKARFWRAEKARLGPGGVWAIGDALRAQVHASRPDWPTALEREADLETHVRVARSLSGVRARADD